MKNSPSMTNSRKANTRLAPTQMNCFPSFPLKSNHSTVLAPAVALATLNSPMTIKANTNPAVSQSMRCDMGAVLLTTAILERGK